MATRISVRFRFKQKRYHTCECFLNFYKRQFIYRQTINTNNLHSYKNWEQKNLFHKIMIPVVAKLTQSFFVEPWCLGLIRIEYNKKSFLQVHLLIKLVVDNLKNQAWFCIVDMHYMQPCSLIYLRSWFIEQLKSVN